MNSGLVRSLTIAVPPAEGRESLEIAINHRPEKESIKWEIVQKCCSTLKQPSKGGEIPGTFHKNLGVLKENPKESNHEETSDGMKERCSK